MKVLHEFFKNKYYTTFKEKLINIKLNVYALFSYRNQILHERGKYYSADGDV